LRDTTYDSSRNHRPPWRYLEATREVLQRHGGLWFLDESYVVSRKKR